MADGVGGGDEKSGRVLVLKAKKFTWKRLGQDGYRPLYETDA